MNGSNVNPDLVRNIHNFSAEGSRLKCSGYRIKSNVMWII
jgi:hypothetical protein